MQAVEFETDLTEGGSIVLPPGVAERLPDAGRVRVIVLVPDAEFGDDGTEEDDAAWRRFGAEQFFRDDDPADAVYDILDETA